MRNKIAKEDGKQGYGDDSVFWIGILSLCFTVFVAKEASLGHVGPWDLKATIDLFFIMVSIVSCSIMCSIGIGLIDLPNNHAP